MQLADRTILVTGGSSGIGRAVSRSLADEGALVLTVGRRSEALHKTAARREERIRTITADLTEAEGREWVARKVQDATSSLDVVIHAAGLLGTPSVPLELYPDADWYEVFEANVSSVHFLHRELAPLLHRADRPTVIGLSSTVGRRGRAGWGMYAISKFALEGWLEVLADEWGERGRVYSVNPGGTRTPMRATAMPDENPEELPTPADIAPVFLYLARADCGEPSGTKLEARAWIGRDPWV